MVHLFWWKWKTCWILNHLLKSFIFLLKPLTLIFLGSFLVPNYSPCSAVSVCLQGNYDHVLAPCPLTFPFDRIGYTPFHRTVLEERCGDWEGLHGHVRKRSQVSVFCCCRWYFCKWVPVEIYVYFLQRKYQVKPLLFPWFSAVCTSTVIYRRKQCILKYYRIKHHNKSA